MESCEFLWRCSQLVLLLQHLKDIGKALMTVQVNNCQLLKSVKETMAVIMEKLFIAIQTHMELHLQTVPNVQRLIQINPFWVFRSPRG